MACGSPKSSGVLAWQAPTEQHSPARNGPKVKMAMGRRGLKRLRLFLILLALGTISADLLCQELQPRHWAHLPSGINFIGAGTNWTYGDILFDPALKIENTEQDAGAVAVSYVRTFDWFGKQTRIDVALPYASGSWQGLLNGEPASLRRRGFGDAQLRFSLNFLGSPALKSREFAKFQAKNPINTTMGCAIAVILPTGEYRSDQLINLGGNRWIVRPELGVLHQRHKWQFEVTGSVFMYGDNDEFWQGAVRKQDPLWFIQGHAIYTFRPGLWASLSGGYAMGSRSEVNGVSLADDSRLRYWKLTVGMPINARQGLNFAFASGSTNTPNDADLGRFSLAWSLMFGK